MFKRSGTLFALAATLLMTASAAEADGGNRRHHHHMGKRINIRTSVRIVDRSRVTINVDRLRHRQHRNVNTYSGDVAVYSRPGVGTWSYGSMSTTAEFEAAEPDTKIIDMTGGKNDCSMEHGVCVIRP